MSLKKGRPGSDTPLMFFSAQSAPDPATTQLEALRLSLNKPVLAIDELPLGPAMGVVAVVQGPAYGCRLVVAIRSMRTDQAVFFWSDPISRESNDAAGLLDTAVGFAESMGFLFDDDLEPAADAGRLWADWVAKAASPPRIASPPGAERAEGERSRSASPPGAERAEGERSRSASPPGAERAEGERSRSDAAVIPLTKFRLRPGRASIGGQLDPLGIDPEEKERDWARWA